MTDRELLKRYRVVTPCSTVVSGFYGAEHTAPATNTFRVYADPRAYGRQVFRFQVVNVRETTRGEMGDRLGGTPGGLWRIDEAFVADGGTRRDGALRGAPVPVTFDGLQTRAVAPGEVFLSDEVALELPEGHDLAFSWTVTRVSDVPAIPCAAESVMAAYAKPSGGAGAAASDGFAMEFNGRAALPSLLLRRTPSDRLIAFLGDSVTQGYGTGEGREAFWVAGVIRGLPEGVNALNLGSGWARAYDAAADGPWLKTAKAADEAVVCLGINDIGTCRRPAREIAEDLGRIVRALKAANPEMRVTLFTLPPFDFSGGQLDAWRQLNDWIRGGGAPEADVFDTVPVLGQPEPDGHRTREEYRFLLDAHPNARAGEALAGAFLAWRAARR